MAIQTPSNDEQLHNTVRPCLSRTTGERQLAMDAFISSMYDTDEATQAQIETGIDKLLERIYRDRSPQPQPSPKTRHPPQRDPLFA
jgi:hypothetical protein